MQIDLPVATLQSSSRRRSASVRTSSAHGRCRRQPPAPRVHPPGRAAVRLHGRTSAASRGHRCLRAAIRRACRAAIGVRASVGAYGNDLVAFGSLFRVSERGATMPARGIRHRRSSRRPRNRAARRRTAREGREVIEGRARDEDEQATRRSGETPNREGRRSPVSSPRSARGSRGEVHPCRPAVAVGDGKVLFYAKAMLAALTGNPSSPMLPTLLVTLDEADPALEKAMTGTSAAERRAAREAVRDVLAHLCDHARRRRGGGRHRRSRGHPRAGRERRDGPRARPARTRSWCSVRSTAPSRAAWISPRPTAPSGIRTSGRSAPTSTPGRRCRAPVRRRRG